MGRILGRFQKTSLVLWSFDWPKNFHFKVFSPSNSPIITHFPLKSQIVSFIYFFWFWITSLPLWSKWHGPLYISDQKFRYPTGGRGESLNFFWFHVLKTTPQCLMKYCLQTCLVLIWEVKIDFKIQNTIKKKLWIFLPIFIRSVKIIILVQV